MQTSSVVSIREKHLETRLKAGGVAVLEETDYSQLAGWTLSLSTQAHCSPQRDESPCHRCLKLLSTMMAMNGDETNESNTY